MKSIYELLEDHAKFLAGRVDNRDDYFKHLVDFLMGNIRHHTIINGQREAGCPNYGGCGCTGRCHEMVEVSELDLLDNEVYQYKLSRILPVVDEFMRRGVYGD